MYLLISIAVVVIIILAIALWLLRNPGDKPPYPLYGEKIYKDSLLKLKTEYSNCQNSDETLAATIRFLSQFISCEPCDFKANYFQYLNRMNYNEEGLYSLVKKYSLLTRMESKELKISNELTPSEMLSDLTYYYIEKVMDKPGNRSALHELKKAA